MVGAVDRCPQRLALVAILLASTAASADGVTWTAPATCPDAQALRANVEHRLDRSLDGISLAVDVRVNRARGEYIAHVDAAGEPERKLASARCADLADAVAIVVARVAADALAEADEIEIHAPPAPSVQTHEDDGSLVDRVTLPPPSNVYIPKPWTISARVSGVSGIGVIPRVGVGGEIAISVRAGEHLAELGASRWVASASQFHAGTGAKMDIDLDATIGRYGWRPPTLPLRAWAAVEVGTMRGNGGAFSQEHGTLSDRWLAVGTGFAIAWQARPWIRLVASTETMVALRRATFVAGSMELYAPAPMSVRTTCGLELGWQ